MPLNGGLILATSTSKDSHVVLVVFLELTLKLHVNVALNSIMSFFEFKLKQIVFHNMHSHYRVFSSIIKVSFLEKNVLGKKNIHIL